MHYELLDSARPRLEEALANAAERTGKYEWIAAAEFYQRGLDELEPAQDLRRAAGIMELKAECYFKAAFQAQTRDEFQRMMRGSQGSWEESSLLQEKSGSQLLAKRAKSRALYASFWHSDDPDQDRVMIQKCLQLALEIVHSLEAAGDEQKLGESLFDLLVYQEKALHLSSDREQLVDLFEAAADTAWKILEEFQGVARDETILESINILVTMYSEAENILEPPKYEQLEKKLEKIKNLSPQLSEKIRTHTAVALNSESLGHIADGVEGDTPKALKLFENGISSAKETKDNYVTGRLETLSSANLRFLALREEYVEKRREYLEKAVRLALSAIRNLQPSSPPGVWLKEAYSRYVDASTLLALQVETDSDRKQRLLRETIEYTQKGMVNENSSFLPLMKHALSKAAYFLATMELGPEEKTELLLDALPLREETVRTVERFYPHSWDYAVMLNYSALLKAELSKLEKDQASKRGLMEGAAADMEECVKLCARITGTGSHAPGMIRAQAQYNEWHGDVLTQLYDSTLDPAQARRTLHAYEDAISFLSKSESLGQIPAVRWKIARTYNSLREYKESCSSFQKAANEYKVAAEKLPGLAATFDEFSRYMDAWALVEDARLKHNQELFGTAADDYTGAANNLKSTKTWAHLSKHYSGCSVVEVGEILSNQEKRQAAIESFKEAQATFRDAKNEIEARLNTVQQPQERKELGDWLEITLGRVKYCQGRTQLEEARVLDEGGEEEGSSTKYREASEAFGSLFSEAHDEQTRKELEALMLVSDAWAKMKSAESTSSPELYAEAAESFTRVEKATFGRRSQLAALANASMCKALESGSLFRRTRDKKLYEEIKKRLVTAADFYEEAGIKRAADWTRATQRFFDALTYLGEAEVQLEPQKKTEFYDLAEKQLQLASKLYGDSGYSKKREEALSLLRQARGQKELLLTPLEALDESPALRGTTLSPLSFTPDHAMGLERLESANVVGSLRTDHSLVSVGSDLTVELEMANVGKTAAILLKIDNVSQEGLRVVRDKMEERIEDGYIDMRGRRLDYLKTREVKVPIKAKAKGTYQLRPRVLYVDEKGAYRSYEFEPTRIVVTEAPGGVFLESERRLSAIMFTDIVGYTSITEQNEPLALELLEEHRRVLRPMFPRHSGREIKTVGDMFLIEFASALEAVRCAISIQEALSKRNLECSKDKIVQIRIGIHVGDVEHSHGDVYGEAVNVASRIEPLAEPGGIVVTRQVYDQIRNRPGIKMESMGSHKLKNVKESLEVFKVSL